MAQSTRIPYSLFFSYVGYIIFSVFWPRLSRNVDATMLRSAITIGLIL